MIFVTSVLGQDTSDSQSLSKLTITFLMIVNVQFQLLDDELVTQVRSPSLHPDSNPVIADGKLKPIRIDEMICRLPPRDTDC